MSNLLSVRNLHKSFIEGDEEIQVLRGLDLELKMGERLAVIGESGVERAPCYVLERSTVRRRARLYQGKEIPMDDEAALSHFGIAKSVCLSVSLFVAGFYGVGKCYVSGADSGH
jgi:ABC-type dipeptide/oligopeptide/nickel transport system ATPase component